MSAPPLSPATGNWPPAPSPALPSPPPQPRPASLPRPPERWAVGGAARMRRAGPVPRRVAAPAAAAPAGRGRAGGRRVRGVRRGSRPRPARAARFRARRCRDLLTRSRTPPRYTAGDTSRPGPGRRLRRCPCPEGCLAGKERRDRGTACTAGKAANRCGIGTPSPVCAVCPARHGRRCRSSRRRGAVQTLDPAASVLAWIPTMGIRVACPSRCQRDAVASHA
jgi:hypothetical protein